MAKMNWYYKTITTYYRASALLTHYWLWQIRKNVSFCYFCATHMNEIISFSTPQRLHGALSTRKCCVCTVRTTAVAACSVFHQCLRLFRFTHQCTQRLFRATPNEWNVRIKFSSYQQFTSDGAVWEPTGDTGDIPVTRLQRLKVLIIFTLKRRWLQLQLKWLNYFTLCD